MAFSDDIWIAVIGVLGSILVAYITAFSTTKSRVKTEAISLEHRLTRLEERQEGIKENMFSKQDRDCLYQVKFKLEWYLQYLEGSAADALTNPPELDSVLAMISKQGVSATLEEINSEKKEELVNYLEERAKKERSMLKKDKARFLLGRIKLEEKLKEQPECPAPLPDD